MREWLISFLKSAGRKLLILAAIALAVAAVVFFATRPVVSESILETVRLEDGAFTLDGLRAGTTREDVIAWMDAHHYAWTEGQKYEHAEGSYYETFFEDLDGVSWISLSYETRVSELGRATVRRSYFFRDGLLTHVDLEMDPSKKPPEDSIARMEAAANALTGAFGAPTSAGVPRRLEEAYGEEYVTWEAPAGGGLDVIGRRWAVRDRMSDRLKDAATVPHQDYFLIVIRVRFSGEN